MTHPQHTPTLASLEEAITVLFCLIDDAYAFLNPSGPGYDSLKKLSDSEVLTLGLFQQLRGVESERSFLRDAQRFFVHLFSGVVGMHPSSLHRRVRKLRTFLEPLRRQVLPEFWSAIPKPSSSTQRSWRYCIRVRSSNRRVSRGQRGLGGDRSPSTV